MVVSQYWGVDRALDEAVEVEAESVGLDSCIRVHVSPETLRMTAEDARQFAAKLIAAADKCS